MIVYPLESSKIARKLSGVFTKSQRMHNETFMDFCIKYTCISYLGAITSNFLMLATIKHSFML